MMIFLRPDKNIQPIKYVHVHIDVLFKDFVSSKKNYDNLDQTILSSSEDLNYNIHVNYGKIDRKDWGVKKNCYGTNLVGVIKSSLQLVPFLYNLSWKNHTFEFLN